MAIDKGLYQAPQGLDIDAMLPDVEIIMPDMVENEDGSVDVTLVGGTDMEGPIPFDANLVEYLSEEDMSLVVSDVMDLVQSDIDSRKDWVDTYVEGLKILGLNYEERVEPWEGACGVSSTVGAEAGIWFQAET